MDQQALEAKLLALEAFAMAAAQTAPKETREAFLRTFPALSRDLNKNPENAALAKQYWEECNRLSMYFPKD
jgi:hypothetical protein